MALDGIVISSLVQELQQCVGARINKIHQPTPRDLMISLRGNGIKDKLIISANPTYPRMHFTSSSQPNPLEAPMFCMLLRKHCEGGTIDAVSQIGRERIIYIDITHRDEIGDRSAKRIIVEIMGRHSNIILVDPTTNTIFDGIHHVTPALSSFRVIMPGVKYNEPPEQHKVDPFTIHDSSAFKTALSLDSSEDEVAVSSKQLVQTFSGLSPVIAQEIIYRSITGTSTVSEDSSEKPLFIGNDYSTYNIEGLWEAFHKLILQVQHGETRPEIVTASANDKMSFSATTLTHIDGTRQSFNTMSECLEAFYGDKAERDTVKQRANDLIRFVTNEKQKNEQKIIKLEESYLEAQDADRYRIIGELLTTYMHQIKRGDKSIQLINYYDENQSVITIELDSQLNPSEHAQKYFRKYTKQKNALTVIEEQLAKTKDEIAYFTLLLTQLEQASLADIEEIREELVTEGYMRERVKKGMKKKKANRPTVLYYKSSEGIDIVVGKNNLQNEYVTNRLADSNDTWLHTKDIPGSHVVIRSRTFGNETLELAAMLAAHFSQAKHSSLVPVDYTLIRHVKKPSGSKPGFVIYDNQKTLYITPDEAKIKAAPCEAK